MNRSRWQGQMRLFRAKARLWWCEWRGDDAGLRDARQAGMEARMQLRRDASEARVLAQMHALASRHPELRMPESSHR